MSRIGKQPIPVPSGVKVDIKGANVKITGKNGTLDLDVRPELKVEITDGKILVSCLDRSKRTNAFSGLTRSLINNMIIGTETGFQKRLVVEGVGYKADIKGSSLTLNVGYSNPVIFDLPQGVSGSVDKKNMILLESIDKELLGLTAAKIRNVRKPEPYKGKGIRYENEHIVRKAGKTAAK
jgi:large subunit ribosomal protein L6